MKIKNWLKIHRHIDRTQRRSLQQIKEYDKIVNDEYWEDVEKAKEKREKRLCKYHSVFAYCDCGNELETTDSFLNESKDGTIVRYKCSKCGEISEWNYGIYSCPIRIDK